MFRLFLIFPLLHTASIDITQIYGLYFIFFLQTLKQVTISKYLRSFLNSPDILALPYFSP